MKSAKYLNISGILASIFFLTSCGISREMSADNSAGFETDLLKTRDGLMEMRVDWGNETSVILAKNNHESHIRAVAYYDKKNRVTMVSISDEEFPAVMYIESGKVEGAIRDREDMLLVGKSIIGGIAYNIAYGLDGKFYLSNSDVRAVNSRMYCIRLYDGMEGYKLIERKE